MIMDSKNKNTTKSEITKVNNGKSGKNNKNSTGLGSQLMYLAIGAFVLFTLYSYLSGGVESKIKSYSINEFVTAIDNNSVQKVVIDGDTVLLYNNKFDINDKSVNSASTTAIGKFTKESNQSLLNILSSYNVSTSTLNNLDIQVKTDGVAMKIAMLISNLLPIIFFGILIYMMLRGVI
jgi:ATP-dependent Zn protease